MVIQHNIPALNANRQLGINNASTAKNLEKLSSGFKINRAADDAAGLAISEKMRGQIRGTMMGTQNVNMGINLIQTAEGGLNENHAILQRMRELAVQSANGTYQDEDRAQIDKEFQALKEEIDRIAKSTHYNGIPLLCVPPIEPESPDDDVIKEIQVNVLTPPVQANGRFNFFTTNSNGQTYPLQCGGSSSWSNPAIRVNGVEYSFWNNGISSRTNLTLVQNTVNNGSGTWSTTFSLPASSGLDVTIIQKVSVVSNPGGIGGESYKIDYEVINNAPANPVTFDLMYHMDSAPDVPFQVNGSDVTQAGTYQGGSLPSKIEMYAETENINSIIGINSGSGFRFTPGSEPDRVHVGYYSITHTFSNLGNGPVGENGYAVIWDNRTVNSTTPSMTLTTYYGVRIPQDILDTINPTKQKTQAPELWIQSGANRGDGMYIELCDSRPKALGIDKTVVDPRESANEAIALLDESINIVSSYRASFGASQNRLESAARNNGVMTENLQAAESAIRDVDMAKEMMEFTKNNILVQAAQSMLAQANQLPQGVLSLLR